MGILIRTSWIKTRIPLQKSSFQRTVWTQHFIMPSTTSKRTHIAISKRSGKIKPVRIPMLSVFPRTEEFDAKIEAMDGIALTPAARKKYARFLK